MITTLAAIEREDLLKPLILKLTINYSLPIIHYPLSITHYPLPITHYPLPIIHYP